MDYSDIIDLHDKMSAEDIAEENMARRLSKMSADTDPVNHPSHYNKNGIEVIDVIDAYTPDPYSYCMGNVIKYVLRHMDKGKPKQDLEKARWYLNKMIEEWDK